jgi:hypothetical protein
MNSALIGERRLALPGGWNFLAGSLSPMPIV